MLVLACFFYVSVKKLKQGMTIYWRISHYYIMSDYIMNTRFHEMGKAVRDIFTTVQIETQ